MFPLLSYEDRAAIVNVFTPQVRLHPWEKFFPITIDDALGACELRQLNEQQTLIHRRVTSQDKLFELPGGVSDEDTFLQIVDESKITGAPSDKLNKVPVFARISTIQYNDGAQQKVFWDILYNFMYLHNGSTVPMSSTIGAHPWDNETVIVRIDPSVSPPNYNAIKTVFLSQHSAGAWYQPKRLQFVGPKGKKSSTGNNNNNVADTHVVVYAAKYSHAHYPIPAAWPRLFGMATDYTSDSGVHWLPKAVLVAPPDNNHNNQKGLSGAPNERVADPRALWTEYRGKFGPHSQRGIFQRGWITINHKLNNATSMDLISKALGTKRGPIGLVFIIVPIASILLAGVYFRKLEPISIMVGILSWMFFIQGIRMYMHVDL